MSLAPARAALIAAFLLPLAPTSSARAACDVASAATDLTAARGAIDDACPCAAAMTHSAHIAGARPVIAGRVSARDGRVLLLFVRPDGTAHAVRAVIVAGH